MTKLQLRHFLKIWFNWKFHKRFRRESDDDTLSNSLQFELGGENDDNVDSITDSDVDENAQNANVEELNKIGSKMAQLGMDENNPIGAATVDAIKDDDPSGIAIKCHLNFNPYTSAWSLCTT